MVNRDLPLETSNHLAIPAVEGAAPLWLINLAALHGCKVVFDPGGSVPSYNLMRETRIVAYIFMNDTADEVIELFADYELFHA